MALSKKKKEEIIDKYQKHPNDTGSAQLQVALLSHRIKDLTEHLKDHSRDHSSRRGLLKMVGQRKRLMEYVEEEDPETFHWLREELDIRMKSKQGS